MSEEQGTIEKMLIPQPFKFFDSHGHPGLEKKGISDRPGCLDFWCGNTVVSRSMMGARVFLGDPNPTKIITTAEECPEMSPEVFVKFMDECNVEGMCLQAIHGISENRVIEVTVDVSGSDVIQNGALQSQPRCSLCRYRGRSCQGIPFQCDQACKGVPAHYY